MRRFQDMDDARIERLFDGRVPIDDADLGQVARFLGDVSDALPEEQTAALETEHLTAITEAVRLLPADAPAGSSRDSWLRPANRPAFRTAFARGWAIASVALAGILAFGGAAYAGVLPSPIQHAVATAVQAAGLHIPDPEPTVSVGVDTMPGSPTPDTGGGSPSNVGVHGSSQSTSGTAGVNKGGQDLPAQSNAVDASKGKVTGDAPTGKKATPRSKRQGVGPRERSSDHGKPPQDD
jgi:hypothetical protein